MGKGIRHSAESFDIMQYLYRKVHEPLIHCYIHFDGYIEETVLQNAVTASLNAVPLIRCCFDLSSGDPCWVEHNFTGEDIVHVITIKSDDESKILLASSIDIFHEPQIKIFLCKGQTSDTLCILINHMVCDGAGLKQYLYLLCECYTKLLKDNNYKPEYLPARRSTAQLFRGLSWVKKLSILLSKYSIPKQSRQMQPSLQGDAANPFFVTRDISKEDFLLVSTYAKSQGATANDLFLAAYIRQLYRKTRSCRIVIPCPVDLRKYVRGKTPGICNLTTNYYCDISVKETDKFEDTLRQTITQMKQQKGSLNCLKSIILLENVFHALPFRFLQRVFHRLFTIPVVSYTNLGIIDQERLKFGNINIQEAFLTGAIKYVPYFQLSISTYKGKCTCSCNLHGTEQDLKQIASFLEEMIEEIVTVTSKR